DAYLEDLALRYRVAPRPSFNNSTLVFNLGTMGSEIDINSTKMLIDRALFSPLTSERNVTLPVVTVDNHLSDMSVLRQAILEFFATRGVIYNGADSVISVYVRDLAGGAEMGIHEDALHSGVSTMKIGLLASYFRTLYQEAPPNMKFHMAAAVLCSSNADANALIDQIGGNNIQTGAAFVTDTYCQVGAGNTQINRHFWIGPAGENGIPTNYYDVVDNGTCPVPETAPIDYSVAVTVDPYLPTTAADMGQMLSSIYQCA